MKTAHRTGPKLLMAAVATIAALTGSSNTTMTLQKRPAVLYTAPRHTAFRGMMRPPVGWRKAQGRRRHQEIQRRQRRNRRAQA